MRTFSQMRELALSSNTMTLTDTSHIIISLVSRPSPIMHMQMLTYLILMGSVLFDLR